MQFTADLVGIRRSIENTEIYAVETVNEFMEQNAEGLDRIYYKKEFWIIPKLFF